jgi:hypothetical protein
VNEEHDYRILDLKRTIADDALTIHTCEEIIERTKKELGDYRELYFDMKKERDAALTEVAKLKEQINDIYVRM